jgi:hypothetical protein
MSNQALPRAARRLKPRQVLIAIGLTLMAGIITGAVAIASRLNYATTNNIPQCNDVDTTPAVLTCDWIEGQLANTHWVEGSSIPHEVQISGISAHAVDVHTYTWSVTWSDQVFYHGYDWMTSWDQSKATHIDYIGTPLDLNNCTAGNPAAQTACTTLHSTGYSQTIVIPDDTFISGSYLKNGEVGPRIAAFEAIYGNRTLTLWTDQPITGTAVITFYHAADSAGFPAIINGGDTGAGSFLMRYTVYFTSSANLFMLEYGLHFGISGNPYVDPMAWGYDATNGGYGAAGLYPAAPWHVKDPLMDNGDGNMGSQDNQAKVQNPELYPLTSKANYNSTTHRVSDAITMTLGGNFDDISGTVDFYLCGPDTTYSFGDPIPDVGGIYEFGCTSPLSGTFLGTINVGPADDIMAASPVFTPTTSGLYCFYTAFNPSTNPADDGVYDYPPFADTDGTTECFAAFGPTAITLSDFKANPSEDGTPLLVGLLTAGLLGVVAIAVWRKRSLAGN